MLIKLFQFIKTIVYLIIISFVHLTALFIVIGAIMGGIGVIASIAVVFVMFYIWLLTRSTIQEYFKKGAFKDNFKMNYTIIRD